MIGPDLRIFAAVVLILGIVIGQTFSCACGYVWPYTKKLIHDATEQDTDPKSRKP